MSTLIHRRWMVVLPLLAFLLSVWAQASEYDVSSPSRNQQFAASWWTRAGTEERSGFLNGLADCMTWTVHKKGFSQTPEQLMGKISKYYKAHRDEAGLSVLDVWQKLDAQGSFDTKAADQGAEVWKNAHWYLNGDWWRQVSQDQELGFVEGYLWCMKTQAPASADRYSDSPRAYWQKIGAFVDSHPKLGNESVADTLRRFRDRDIAPSPR
jgi:hypothetical protein